MYRKVRAALGSRFRFAISGGAPLAKELAEFFWAVGVEVYEGYGLTETSPVIALACPSAWRLGTVGKIVPGVECRIAPDGEILTRGPHVMKGYFNKPKETADAIDADGWFHTGDIGRIDEDGFLMITDRKKEILVNSNGKNIAPAPIEGHLKGHPFVSLPVVIGDRRKFLSCLFVPNFEKLSAWAKENGLGSLSMEDLVKEPRVVAIFQGAVDDWNAGKPHEMLINRFAILPRDLTIESGELTPTLKVKRRIIDDHFKHLIDGMYAGRPRRPRRAGPGPERMRVVVALGGNALLRRGEPMTAEHQRANVRRAAVALAPGREGARARHLARERPAGGPPRPSGRERARRRALPARRSRGPDRGDDRLHDRAGARESPAVRGPVRDAPHDGRGRSRRTRRSRSPTSRSVPSTRRRKRTASRRSAAGPWRATGPRGAASWRRPCRSASSRSAPCAGFSRRGRS